MWLHCATPWHSARLRLLLLLSVTQNQLERPPSDADADEFKDEELEEGRSLAPVRYDTLSIADLARLIGESNNESAARNFQLVELTRENVEHSRFENETIKLTESVKKRIRFLESKLQSTLEDNDRLADQLDGPRPRSSSGDKWPAYTGGTYATVMKNGKRRKTGGGGPSAGAASGSRPAAPYTPAQNANFHVDEATFKDRLTKGLCGLCGGSDHKAPTCHLSARNKDKKGKQQRR
ncbi:hypothetical protein WJX75_004207 [Coccomyxa subellipsoidea]|uniref:Uncharacterized protein n=1 Tax=Coccomyxa subellipsoidea TaxID=248742 RepID=A0ABR2Z3C5_9CHLO